jgi:hypothetical protein
MADRRMKDVVHAGCNGKAGARAYCPGLHTIAGGLCADSAPGRSKGVIGREGEVDRRDASAKTCRIVSARE